MYKITMLDSGLPKWRRTAFADEEQVFLPCGTFGDEHEELLRLVVDGETVLENETHAYASTDWLLKRYPDQKEEIHRIVDFIREEIHIASVVESSSDQ